MNELQIFENTEFGEVRAVAREGQPWFVAKDVCDNLGLDTSNLSKMLDEDEKGTYSIRTPGGEQEMLIISEPGLYFCRKRDWDADPDFNAGEKCMNMTMTISHADDFTRSHPVLTGKRKGTTLRERLERIRDTTRKASVRKAAEQWLREMEAKA